MNSVILSSTSIYKPKYKISNKELVESYNVYVAKYNLDHSKQIEKGIIEPLKESSVEFIEKVSGIKNRNVIEKEGIINHEIMKPIILERSNDELSLQAQIGVSLAKDAMKRANLEPEDIDLVIFACSNIQRPYPAISIEIQSYLGINGSAYDMNVACSSATFALENGYIAISSGYARRVLIISVEICSAHNNFRDRDCHFIFGDAGSAIILENQNLLNNNQGFKILGTLTKTVFSNNIRNNFGFLNNCDPNIENRYKSDKLFKQNGRIVFKEVSPQVVDNISNLLKKVNLTVDNISRFWLHQANESMNNLIMKKILGREANLKEAPIILDEYANTSSTGSIIAFHFNHDDLKSSQRGIICSFGAGYSIGSVVIEKC